MMEMMNKVLTGWPDYITHQKLPAVLLAVLMLMFLTDRWKQKKIFWLYGLGMTVLCLFPPTAAALMLYQTRFYDYIWVFVPLLMPVYVAAGLTEFISDLDALTRHRRYGRALVSLALILILVGCMGRDTQAFEGQTSRQDKAAATASVQELLEIRGSKKMCLFAPKELMEAAREQDGNIRLLYGRNMWDNALNAYSYDTYGKTIRLCYRWMEGVHETGNINYKGMNGIKYMKTAFQKGATHIVLPGDLDKKTIRKIKKKTGGTIYRIDNYVVLKKKPDAKKSGTKK